MAISNVSYSAGLDLESYLVGVANSDIYDRINLDNYQDYNTHFGGYYDIRRGADKASGTGGYVYGTSDAYDISGTLAHQKWWDQVGGHTMKTNGSNVWSWGTNDKGLTTDKYGLDGKFIGDNYFGNLTYRRVMNYLTAEEAYTINKKLKDRGLKFILDERGIQFDNNGRKMYKLVPLNSNPRLGGTTPGSGTDPRPDGGSGTEITGSENGGSGTYYEPLKRNTNPEYPEYEGQPWSDWAPLTYGWWRSKVSNAALAEYQKLMFFPYPTAPWLLTTDSDAYLTQKQYLNLAALTRYNYQQAGQSLSDLSRYMDFMNQGLEAASQYENSAVQAQDQAHKVNVTQEDKVSEVNKTTHSNLRSQTAQVDAAAGNNILNANGQQEARDNYTDLQYVADLYASATNAQKIDNLNLAQHLAVKDQLKLMDLLLELENYGLNLKLEDSQVYKKFMATADEDELEELWKQYLPDSLPVGDDNRDFNDASRKKLLEAILASDDEEAQSFIEAIKKEQEEHAALYKLKANRLNSMAYVLQLKNTPYLTNLLDFGGWWNPKYVRSTPTTLYSKKGGKLSSTESSRDPYLEYMSKHALTFERGQYHEKQHHIEAAKLGQERMKIVIDKLSAEEQLLLRSVFSQR